MEKIIRISEAGKHIGEVVSLRGWIYNHRSSGKIRFLEIRDGSTQLLQAVVAPGTADEKSFELSGTLTQESSLVITGKIKQHPKKPDVYEMDVLQLQVLQLADQNYPISHKEHGPEHLMLNRHLWLRTPRQVAIARVRASIIKSIRDFFDSDPCSLRRHKYSFPNGLFRRKSLPYPKWTTLRGSGSHGVWKNLCFRTHLSCRKV